MNKDQLTIRFEELKKKQVEIETQLDEFNKILDEFEENNSKYIKDIFYAKTVKLISIEMDRLTKELDKLIKEANKLIKDYEEYHNNLKN